MSYFEEYDDMFSEPSKAEQIIKDAKAALWNELTEEVKQLMDNANEASTKANKLIAEISSLNFEKTELEKEIKQLREQKVYVEAHEVPARQVKAIVNHLTKGFQPGDECWVIGSEYERHTCEKCGGKKKVSADIGGETLEIDCPTCRGYGTVSKSTYFPKKSKITDVRMLLCFDSSNRMNIWSTETLKVDGRDDRNRAGSVFKTEEEAKAAIKERYGEDSDGKS
jgi:hypothetical protein